MKRPIEGEMVKGHTEMLILALLCGGIPKHGYLIRQELADVSQWEVHPSLGRIYPLLRQMEKKGWLKSRRETVCEKRVRNTYRITPAGKAELKVRAKKWERFSAGINRLLQACG